MDCKIIMFKVHKQDFSIHSRAMILSLSNFLKIQFCIFTRASSYCDRKLSWVYTKKISKEKILKFAM